MSRRGGVAMVERSLRGLKGLKVQPAETSKEHAEHSLEENWAEVTGQPVQPNALSPTHHHSSPLPRHVARIVRFC